MKINPTLRLRDIIDLICILTHLRPREKAKKKRPVLARHFHIWDTGASSSLISDDHRFFIETRPALGTADMIIWEEGNLYNSRDGQELTLRMLRKEIPAKQVGDLLLMLAAKQESNKRGKNSGQVIPTTIDAEIPTENGCKIIPFRTAA